MTPDVLPQHETRTGLPSFLKELLTEQQDLTAVARFSQFHDESAAPRQQQHYAALLPATSPGPGEQYAFEVDLDRCSGCKACVTACHELNGLDDDETWRSVGLLHGGSASLPILQHVTTACHHCLDPACLNACPTLAYEKDPVTGIVRHLDDQCFGCQYCILACPYEVPRYSPRRGIVRKCDMCSQRLALSEAPACAQACPHEAIRIRTVRQSDVAADCEMNPFLPGAPDPQYTQPTTNYRTRRPFPRNLIPADYYAVHAEHAHVPLIVMLVLTQLSAGAFLTTEVLHTTFAQSPDLMRVLPWQTLGALLTGLVALAASTCHLGRPWLAYRAVLGLRTSWLSREIVVFGGFANLAILYTALVWQGARTDSLILRAVAVSVVALGLAGVFCSAMIYTVTRRPFWSGSATLIRFSLTTLWLGLSTVFLISVLVTVPVPLVLDAFLKSTGTLLCQALIVTALVKLVSEAAIFAHLASKQTTPLNRSARLLTGELSAWTLGRFISGGLGGVVLPLILVANDALSPTSAVVLSVAIAGLSLAGELLERTLYFTAAVAPRMPGSLRT